MGKGYYYFETPDYDDCSKKLWWATKYTGGPMSGLAVYEMIMTPHKKTFNFLSYRYVRTVLPLTTSMMVASSLTCALANLRGKKDDCWNYWWGGLASSVVWTGWFRSSGKGVALGVATATGWSFYKYAVINDCVILPDHIEGSGVVNGAYGGENWGTPIVPGLSWDDPGRRPV